MLKKNNFMNKLFVIGLFLLIAGFSAEIFFPAKSYALKIPKGPFYIVKVKKSFKSAYFDLKQGIEDANFSILAVAPISGGIKSIGYKIPDLKVIDFCKLILGYDLLKYNMNYAAFMPCRIAIYKKGKYTVMVSFLPTYFERFYKNNAKEKKTIIKATKQIMRIMNSVKTGF
jgi:uncharacterized protein (DUF302 family)